MPPRIASGGTLWRHGEKHKAVAYLEGLHAHFQKLTLSPQIWRKLPSNFQKAGRDQAAVHFSRYGQHYIFFKVLKNGDLGIMSILHGRTDMPARLLSDLAALSLE